MKKSRAIEGLESRDMFSAVQLTDLAIGDSAQYKSLLTFKDVHYFAAPASNELNELGQKEFGLYRTDGTVPGTYLLKDQFIGDTVDDAFGDAHALTGDADSQESKILFAANTAEHGCDLWMTDGSSEATVLFADQSDFSTCQQEFVAPVSEFSIPTTLSSFSPLVDLPDGDLLYWSHGETESLLFRTDGTVDGTARIAVVPSTHNGERDELLEYRGNYYFVATTVLSGDIMLANSTGISELWRTDGTVAGTQVVTDVQYPSGDLTSAGDFFYLSGQPQAGSGGEDPSLFQSDGTAEGTRRINTLGFLDSRTPIVAPLGNDAITFLAEFLFSDVELTRIGPQGETTNLLTVFDDESFWPPDGLLAHNGYVYVTIYKNTGEGIHELWRTDGTRDGTEFVAVMTDDSGFGQPLRRLGEIDGRVFFRIGDSNRLQRDQVWVTDGPTAELFIDEPAVTVEVSSEFFPGFTLTTTTIPVVSDFFQINDEQFLFFKTASLAAELWKTDGVDTELVRTFSQSPHAPRSDPFESRSPVVVNGTAYFFAIGGNEGLELWSTDGTAEGTELVRDLANDDVSLQARPDEMLRLGDEVLFWANAGRGFELFSTTNEPVVEFSRTSSTWFEDGSNAFPDEGPVTLRRGSTTSTSTVDIVFSGLSATSAEDFDMSPIRVTFLPGESEKTFVPPIIDDAMREPNEDFTAQLVAVENTLVDGNTHQLTIFDNEPGEQALGDANGDAFVDFNDFTILAASFGKKTSLGPSDGDFDLDGKVTFLDFLVLADNYGRRTSA